MLSCFQRYCLFVHVACTLAVCNKLSSRANTIRWSNAGWMLAKRLRRWANLKPALGRIVFAGEDVVAGPGLILGQCLRCWPNIKTWFTKRRMVTRRIWQQPRLSPYWANAGPPSISAQNRVHSAYILCGPAYHIGNNWWGIFVGDRRLSLV